MYSAPKQDIKNFFEQILLLRKWCQSAMVIKYSCLFFLIEINYTKFMW